MYDDGNNCIASNGVDKLFVSCYQTHSSFNENAENWTLYSTTSGHFDIPLIYANHNFYLISGDSITQQEYLIEYFNLQTSTMYVSQVDNSQMSNFTGYGYVVTPNNLIYLFGGQKQSNYSYQIYVYRPYFSNEC